MQILSIFILCLFSSCQVQVHKMTTISQWAHPYSTMFNGRAAASLLVILFINVYKHLLRSLVVSVIGWNFIVCPSQKQSLARGMQSPPTGPVVTHCLWGWRWHMLLGSTWVQRRIWKSRMGLFFDRKTTSILCMCYFKMIFILSLSQYLWGKN